MMLYLPLSVLLLLLSPCALGAADDGDGEEEVALCEDEDLDCPHRAKRGDCFGVTPEDGGGMSMDIYLAARMAARCRVTCRRLFREVEATAQTAMHQIVRFLGGADDTMESLLGYRINICDLREGWRSDVRENYIVNRVMAASAHESLRGNLRIYTDHGFQKDKVPPALWEKILRMHARCVWAEEPYEEGDIGTFNYDEIHDDGHECSLRNRSTMLLSQIDLTAQMQIGTALKPLAEKWAGPGVRLRLNNVYGFRRYLKGGRIGAHVDSDGVKIISAIINVAQDVDGHPWPIAFLDHLGTPRTMTMEAGDLVWYESAKIPHGREEIFKGRYYDNLFVHFYPV